MPKVLRMEIFPGLKRRVAKLVIVLAFVPAWILAGWLRERFDPASSWGDQLAPPVAHAVTAFHLVVIVVLLAIAARIFFAAIAWLLEATDNYLRYDRLVRDKDIKDFSKYGDPAFPPTWRCQCHDEAEKD